MAKNKLDYISSKDIMETLKEALHHFASSREGFSFRELKLRDNARKILLKLDKPKVQDKVDREKLILEIHRALGGDGWAHSSYAYDELDTHREELEAVADLLVNNQEDVIPLTSGGCSGGSESD